MNKQAAIQPSELILNKDGSIYHLHLQPEDIADTLLFVGDPERVPKVSKYFDRIELKKKKREFVTHTGFIGNKRFTVLSTGIGTDNIDIVLNELDALVNINFKTRQVNNKLKSLRIVRLGTSGTIQSDIATDSILVSTHGLGIDGLLNFYDCDKLQQANAAVYDYFKPRFKTGQRFASIYIAAGDKGLIRLLSKGNETGITVSCPGFYAPQTRRLRLEVAAPGLIEPFIDSRLHKPGPYHITNLEMETSAIYGLAALMGHKACSVNAILANRANKTFSTQPDKTVDRMIKQVLERLA